MAKKKLKEMVENDGKKKLYVDIINWSFIVCLLYKLRIMYENVVRTL